MPDVSEISQPVLDLEDALRVDLGNGHVRCFQAQGFLALGRITTDEELAWLRDVYDTIIRRKTGYTPDELANATDGHGPISLITLISPEGIVSELKNTLFLRNARIVVARLLGVEETHLLSGWRVFFKPAGGNETFWHQDAAYHASPYIGASVWLTLDPATSESGCMHYIKKSHLGAIRPHHVHGGCLIADDVDPAQAVACPVLAGEAIVHHCRTLHGAGPNKTNGPRRALVVVCQVIRDNFRIAIQGCSVE
jgi:hypothetical protein